MGVALLAHHGMIIGLTKVAVNPTRMSAESTHRPAAGVQTLSSISADPALVRLLANMVLRVHAEVNHVY